MGKIKSALELALERTAGIKSDPEAVTKQEAKKRGKRLFARLREEPDLNLAKEIKQEDREQRAWVREGLFEVLIANLNLPSNEQDLANLNLVTTGLKAVIGDSHGVKTISGQVRQFFEQYLGDKQQLIDSLRKQYEPRMREKEQQLAEQFGQAVRLDPASDPEFAKVLQDNLGKLQGSYRSAFSQVYEQLNALFERSK